LAQGCVYPTPSQTNYQGRNTKLRDKSTSQCHIPEAEAADFASFPAQSILPLPLSHLPQPASMQKKIAVLKGMRPNSASGLL
jgi:hypothetical protein